MGVATDPHYDDTHMGAGKMSLFRVILVGLVALFATACGSGGVQSPDFTTQLQSLRIAPLTSSVALGRTVQFVAFGTYTNPPGSDTATSEREVGGVTWSASNSNATIDGSGLATGVSTGTVEISASLGGVDAAAPAVLTVGPAELDSITVSPNPLTLSLGNSQALTATGTYSDGTTAPVSVNWSSNNTGVVTVSPPAGTTTTASSVSEGGATITASSGDVQTTVTVTVGPFQPTVASITVSPNPGTAPVGQPLQFTATAQCTTAAFSSTLGACPTTPTFVWSVDNASVATIDAATGVARGVTVGSAQVTATVGSVSGSAAFNVTPAVVTALSVTPTSASIGITATQTFTANATYSDGSSGPIAADWESSLPTIATVAPVNGVQTVATGVSAGNTLIIASIPNPSGSGAPISAQATLTVNGVSLTSLDHVETAAGALSGRVALGRKLEFVAIGRFSDNSLQPLDDANIDWTAVPSTTLTPAGAASIDGLGFATGTTPGNVTVTAALKSGYVPAATPRSRSANLLVTGDVCTFPLDTSVSATAVASMNGICVGCTVNNEGNIVDANPDNFASLTTVVGLIGGTVSVTVAPGDGSSFDAGKEAGFIVGSQPGTLLTANLLSQRVFIETLLGGSVQERSGPVTRPLRVDLLGVTLVGGIDTALVSFATSLPYDSIRLTVNSGTASALSTVNVFQACAESTPPPPPASLVRVSRIEPATDNVKVGATKGFVAFGVFSDGSEVRLADADLDWSASNGNATVNADGLVAGVTPGTVTITAALKSTVPASSTTRSATATVTVLAEPCTAPFQASAGATIQSAQSLLCLLCSTSNLPNVIDAATTNFATMNVPLAITSLATSSITVASNSPTPFASGGSAGFVITRPVGDLLAAELFAQLKIETLLNGVVQDTSTPGVPLRLDLLGMNVAGDGGSSALISIPTTRPFNQLRLTFQSLLTAGLLNSTLETVNVYQACSSVALPSAP